MIITEIELKDWGPHRHIQAQGLGPVVGLLGPNGAGKSMFLRALEYAFTGKIEGATESYVRNQGQEGAANNASVRVQFVKNGQQGTVFRQVGKTAKRSLEWDGQTVTKARDVDDLMAQILGADKLALSNAIFIAQGDLSRLLFGTPAERQELFSRLMLVSYIEHRQNVVDNKIKSLSGGLQDFTLLLDEAKAQLNQDLSQVGQWEEALSAIPDQSTDLQRIRDLIGARDRVRDLSQSLRAAQTQELEAQAVLRSVAGDGLTGQALRDRLSDRRGDRDRAQAQLDANQALERQARSWTAAVERRDRAQVQVTEIEQKLEPLPAPDTDRIRTLTEERDRRRQWDALNAQLQTRKAGLGPLMGEQQTTAGAYQARSTELEARIKTLESEEQQAVERRAELRAQYQTLDQALKLLAEGKDGHCPLCSAPLADSAFFTVENRDRLLAEGKTAGALVETLSADRRKLALDLAELSSSKTRAQDRLLSALTEVQTLSDDLKPYAGVERTCEDLQADIQTLQEIVNTRDALSLQLTTARYELTLAQGLCTQVGEPAEKPLPAEQVVPLLKELEDSRQQVVELEARERNLAAASNRLDVAAGLVQNRRVDLLHAETGLNVLMGGAKHLGTDLEAADLVRIQTQLEERQRERGEALGRLQQAREQLGRTQSRLQTLEQRAREDEERRLLIDELRRLRQALTKDGVPAAYIRYRFEQLVGLTQEHLTSLDANFAVEQDPDTFASFRFRRLDQDNDYLMPQDKLSGGQRTRLTIAFLLAVQKLVIPEVGFLVLDEPGQGLDGEGVDRLRDLFAGLQHTMGGNENQIMVCDHRPEFESAFSSTIKLKGGLQ